MSRKTFVAGNWKMNETPEEAVALISKLKDGIDRKDVDTCLCVPSIDLVVVAKALKGTDINLGAENFYFEDKGAYTGEISADMILNAGASHIIIGHSERRQIFKEDNDMINKKVIKAIEKKLVPIICCGETLEQRERNETFSWIKSQIVSAFQNVKKEDAKSSIVAYEPIWAIGTGKTATSDEAEEVCAFIRKTIEEIYDKDTSMVIRILYGGSVNSKNASELFKKENIDGGLVGGASLKEEFIDIVNFDKR